MSLEKSLPLQELYEVDERLWVEKMLCLLDEGKLNEIDVVNLKVVLMEMGKSELSAVRSFLRQLIMHLLKADYQPKLATVSWLNSINEQRRNLDTYFEGSLSLKNKAYGDLDAIYKKSVSDASKETGISIMKFPDKLPYTFEQLLDDDFIPKSLLKYRR